MRRSVIPLVALAASVLFTIPIYADLGDQLSKLLSNDGASFDRFGISVAISGTTAIVGAHWEDNDNGFKAGSAYLFDITTGKQLAKLRASDGVPNGRFGISVAIDGDTAIVGSLTYNYSEDTTGSAYLFDISDPVRPKQLAKLSAVDGEDFDHFGSEVAISGTIVVVGARKDDDNGEVSGSAYLFDTTTGKQLFKLLPKDGTAFQWFGYSVAISGTTAIIGVASDDDNGPNSGSAYLFDTATGQQLFKLIAADGAENDYFGRCVSIAGSTAIISASHDDDNGPDSGSAYLFDTITGGQITKLLPNDGDHGDQFGFNSIAISGTIAIVGAHQNDDNGNQSGSAYLFDISTGQQIAKLLPNNGDPYDRFGNTVAISCDTAIVGAIWDDDNGFDCGAAYLFDAAITSVNCPWDLNGDGEVGVIDLLELIQDFGPCDEVCPADFDGDGVVGVLDLLELIANFGSCPGNECPWDVNNDGVVDEDDVHEVHAHLGPCEDPDNCPWDIDGNGVVNGLDVQEVATHFGDCGE